MDEGWVPVPISLDRSRSYDMHSEGPPKADLEGVPHLKVPECLVCNEYECFIY